MKRLLLSLPICLLAVTCMAQQPAQTQQASSKTVEVSENLKTVSLTAVTTATIEPLSPDTPVAINGRIYRVSPPRPTAR
jgi:hypothetical protein